MINIKNAEILCVGTELLIGDIVNTNAAFISKKLASLGIAQYYQAVVGDNRERLLNCINSSLDRCDLLIMTGGLGPTYDDITKECAAECMKKELVLHQESLERIKNFFSKREVPMPETNIKQAMIPEGAIVLKNDNGTAPGVAIEDQERGKIIIMLPGPPNELKAMFNNEVMPYLKQFSSKIFVSKNINMSGIGESAAEEILRDFMMESTNPTIAPYCAEGEVRVRVTASADSEEQGNFMCEEAINKIMLSDVGKFVYGIDTTIEEAVVKQLQNLNLTLASAESCTGGMFAKTVTDVPGVSSVFIGGAVTYANEAKSIIANVDSETIEKYGAVSPQCAEEMARGIALKLNADIGVSSTGIAGPGGGTAEKPVGLVYTAVYYNGQTEVTRHSFNGSREHIRILTVKNIFTSLIKLIRSIDS